MPCPCHAPTMPLFSRPRHGQGMALAGHGKCESDKAALCKSNGKDILNPQRHGMAGEQLGASWARHAMCESAFTFRQEMEHYHDLL